jgi:uncharacterized membrane protein
VTSGGRERLVWIDWMRGFVMVVMALDHASMFFNGGRVSEDSALLYTPGAPLPLAQFLTRWITHLCAPTFVFLAGTALALSVARRVERGDSAAKIDEQLAIRGLVILGCEALMSAAGERAFLQVLYAIGASMLLMVLLRRLPAVWLVVLGVAWLAGGEALVTQWWDPHGNASIPGALLFGQYSSDGLVIIYPVLPWLAMMMLGWAFGALVLARPERARRVLVVAGVAALAVFAVVRAIDGYGNMQLYRAGDSLAQWLHVGKYPPSLSFAGLELGLMALGLAACSWLQPRVTVRRNGPLLVFGQTALLFYLAHFALLFGAGRISGQLGRHGLGATYAIALAVCVALYPVCRWYRSYKQSHPDSFARYI